MPHKRKPTFPVIVTPARLKALAKAQALAAKGKKPTPTPSPYATVTGRSGLTLDESFFKIGASGSPAATLVPLRDVVGHYREARGAWNTKERKAKAKRDEKRNER